MAVCLLRSKLRSQEVSLRLVLLLSPQCKGMKQQACSQQKQQPFLLLRNPIQMEFLQMILFLAPTSCITLMRGRGGSVLKESPSS
mmetsp:Transcript_31028/g.61186  ORF Transcript_31028/g.61186 Transcript_31028/m.61186 type:complete len:85 (-) Transcript_31028:1024-1278(-)